MLQTILCSKWLKWALMGLGGLGGFMISRKKTKKAIVKVGATGGGVAVGYVAWRLLNRMCGGPVQVGEDDYLPMDVGPEDYLGPAESGYYPRPSTISQPDIKSKTPPIPTILTKGGETARNVTPTGMSKPSTYSSPANSTMAPAPGTPGSTKMTSSATRTSGMFGGAYGS